jgi:hypothetical protein
MNSEQVGCQPSNSRVSALETGLSTERKGASEPRWLAASFTVRPRRSVIVVALEFGWAITLVKGWPARPNGILKGCQRTLDWVQPARPIARLLGRFGDSSQTCARGQR